MLDAVIKFINSRLQIYSEKLYSSETDTINIDKDFNIFLGDMNYLSLSGGEKRKIDIALVFAQRDLALNVLGMTSNLIVLDEIYDNLDDTAISVVSEMISNIPDIDSMFVISHMKNVDIKYDSVLQVVKGKDRITAVMDLV
jgi:DNA repair exonuclease SbcCD ATPase subunit